VKTNHPSRRALPTALAAAAVMGSLATAVFSAAPVREQSRFARARSEPSAGTERAGSVGAPAPDPSRELARLRAEEAGAHPPAARVDSRRLAEIGAAYLARGDTSQAIELLSEAVARDEQNGVALAQLTLAYLRNGDVEFAEFYLRQARQLAAGSQPEPEIYVALGYVYEAQGRTDDAIVAWEEALRAGAKDPRLAVRLESARREWGVRHGQSFLAGETFSAFYDPAVPREVVEDTLRYLDRCRLEQDEFFGADLGRMPAALLYQGKRYFALTDSPEWVGAIYDGRIHVPVPPDAAESEGYRALLSHELAHAFITELSRGRAPGWLQEGIAEYLEGRRISVADAALSLAVLPLESTADLSAAFSQRNDWERARAAYRLALFCVQELIADYGPRAAACIVRGLAGGASLETVIQRETGRSLEALEAGWRARLRPSAKGPAWRPGDSEPRPDSR